MGHEPSPLQDESHKQQRFHNLRGVCVGNFETTVHPKKNQSGCHYHQKMLTHCPGIFTDVELVERETCNTLKRCLLEKLKLLGGTLDQEQVLPQEGLVESALTAIIILRCIKISDFLICTGMRFWCGLWKLQRVFWQIGFYWALTREWRCLTVVTSGLPKDKKKGRGKGKLAPNAEHCTLPASSIQLLCAQLMKPDPTLITWSGQMPIDPQAWYPHVMSQVACELLLSYKLLLYVPICLVCGCSSFCGFIIRLQLLVIWRLKLCARPSALKIALCGDSTSTP